MTAGWSGSSLAAGDVAWHAWYRLGVDPMHTITGHRAPVLADLAALINGEIERLTRLVLDQCDIRLVGEAAERVVASAQAAMANHATWSIVGAVRCELMRPEPVPFAPPAAGSWIRGRWLARTAPGRLRARPEATWRGAWHLFTGDLVTYALRVNDVEARTRCGIQITLRSEHQEAAVADTMPAASHACRRCVRKARRG